MKDVFGDLPPPPPLSKKVVKPNPNLLELITENIRSTFN